MVYLKIKSNKNNIIKLYHNHHIIYLNGKNNYLIKLDYDIDNLYMEINKTKIIFNAIKFDINYTKKIHSTKSNIMISLKKLLNKIHSEIIYPINPIPIVQKHLNYLYFPKFKSLLPEWKSETNIFYKISDYLNLKSFRVGITNFKLLELIFNSEYIGKKLIHNFSINIQKYNIVKPYTFRNVFTRRLKSIYDHKPIYNDNLYSVASSRVHYYKTVLKSNSNIIIKGSKFDYKKIIKSNSNFEPKFMIVFRLAPQDYHHFYMPTTGKLINYYYMGDDFQSVGYDFIYSTRFNPLNDNFRLVLGFEHLNSTKRFYLVIIGATTVGSIIVEKLRIGQIYLSKQYLGYFDLGGSCVVFLTEKDFILREDLMLNSATHIETYFSVFDEISNLNNMNYYQMPLIDNKHLNLHYNNISKRKELINKSKSIKILLILIILIILFSRQYRS